MHRPRYLWCLLFAPVLLTLVLAGPGCGGVPEQQLVDQFFRASKLADTMTLGNIAIVSFDPQKDGIVEGYKVISVTPEQTRDLDLIGLSKALSDARAADEAFSKKMREFQDANSEAIDRVLKAEAKGGKVGGRDAQVQAAWLKWREDQKAQSKAVSEARAKLAAERRVAELSVADHDVTTFNGTEATKEVTVEANVKAPDGAATVKTLVLTMQRAILKDPAGQDIVGKWMFTKLQQQ